MNNYIIDPSVFYWINVFGIMQTVFAIIGVFLLLTSIGFAAGWIYNWYQTIEYEERRNETNGKYMRMCRKVTLLALIPGIMLILLSVFIPSKSSSIEMLVVRTATFDNVDWTVQQVKEIVDYIVKALKGAV